RRPAELSGGQQQRVALARALVVAPRILLLDEPLSGLDANLRQEMGELVRSLQRDLAITTLFVTHDQEEAVALADRVALMLGGRGVAPAPRQAGSAAGRARRSGAPDVPARVDPPGPRGGERAAPARGRAHLPRRAGAADACLRRHKLRGGGGARSRNRDRARPG